jgi:hypothetical protein
MAFYDLFKLFTYAFEDDPQTKRVKKRDISGAGISQPDVLPNVRQDGSNTWSSGKGMVRMGNDFIDLSSVTARSTRIKEYDRLRNLPEIEQAMTVIADEACVAGETKVQTVFDGLKTIQWLKENKKEEFFIYSWDFEKNDYTIAIAYDPRIVKKAQTLKILLDDGTYFIATRDHLVLLSNSAWTMTCEIKVGDELMPFFRVPAHSELSKIKKNQYPRIYTNDKGWIHERQFIDEWRLGRKIDKYDSVNKISRMITEGLKCSDISRLMDRHWDTLEYWINKEGFSYKEIELLSKKKRNKRVIGIVENGEIDVYDLSVKEHKNFCGESVIFHNCQKDNTSNVIKIECKNQEILDELNWLMLDRKMLNMNRKLWGYTKKACINGDVFLEICIDPENPKAGILNIKELPAETMYRIESTKGKLFEFQQSAEGPDYEALVRAPVEEAEDSELEQSKAIRFAPEQIVHMRIGEDRRNFYPYGQSLLEPARGPAHQLRLMEDAMIIYRLTRAPERRVFYIDVGQMPSFRAEAFMDRVKDLLRKRKVVKPGLEGAPSVEEKWAAPTADEDFWIPIRPNSNTRVETLPGAQNLGEIDDTVYFRNKLYVALNFPPNYFSSEDVNSTRMTLSIQSVRFARMIERIQEYIEDGLYEIASRHLILLGYPEEEWEDLKIKITISSEYKELSRMEIDNNRFNNANALKGSMLMADWDIYTRILKYTETEAEEMISRMKAQKIEEARLQVMVQNPGLLGIGTPGDSEPQMGTEPGGPNPMLGPDESMPTDQGSPLPGAEGGQSFAKDSLTKPNVGEIAEPEEEEIKKYDLEIISYGQEQDWEDLDWSEMQ